MNEDNVQKIQASPQFIELVHKKTRLGWQLSAIMLIIYYGFILVLAFSPATLGRPLFAGGVMTVGIPIGVLIILSAFILTGIYVRKANTEFDQLNQAVVEEFNACNNA
ncbi:DUF485 domain-containing protein [Neisseriaceae bacterium TC5R-5]|nr:DUF485 domain-containing protein [Neisseriaceae bacterium TC5R-5]